MSKIKPPKITKVVKINTENDLLSAIADVKSTGFGNVGKHIGYVVTDKARREMKNWDFADRMNAAWLLNHPDARIKTNYTFSDTGFPNGHPTTVMGSSDVGGSVAPAIAPEVVPFRVGLGPVALVAVGVLYPIGMALLSNLGIWVSTGVFCYPSIILFVVAGLWGILWQG